MGDVLRLRGHGPEGQLGDGLEETVEPDGAGIRNQIEKVAHEQLRQPARDLRIARPGFDREVGYIFGRSAEDRGHAGFVEMPSVAEHVRRSFDRNVGAPFEGSDGEAAVFVHGRRRESRRRLVERRTQVSIEEANRQLGDLRVSSVDGRQTDVARRHRDRVHSFQSHSSPTRCTKLESTVYSTHV